MHAMKILLCVLAVYLGGQQLYAATLQYVPVTHTVVLCEGSTVDEAIGSVYYMNEDGLCWDEFRARNRKLNAKLFANGRCPQVGDVVHVETRQKK